MPRVRFLAYCIGGKLKVYTVTAHRWGEYESHSYLLGVFDDLQKAISAAKTEEGFRGGKYECEILEFRMNKWKHESDIMKDHFKVIKKRNQDWMEIAD